MDDYADKAKARMTGQATIVATLEDEEKKFQAKIRATPWFSEFKKKYGEEPNLSSSADYDYRKAVKGGAMPQRDKHDNDSYHWPSALPSGEMLKSKDHPTVWKEHYMRATGKNPDDDGVTEAEWKKTLKGHKKGGVIKSSASSRADGIAQRGKTRGKIL
jgi:hypothetical protein